MSRPTGRERCDIDLAQGLFCEKIIEVVTKNALLAEREYGVPIRISRSDLPFPNNKAVENKGSHFDLAFDRIDGKADWNSMPVLKVDGSNDRQDRQV